MQRVEIQTANCSQVIKVRKMLFLSYLGSVPPEQICCEYCQIARLIKDSSTSNQGYSHSNNVKHDF